MRKVFKIRKISVPSAIMCLFLLFYSATLLALYLWGFSTSLKTVDDFMTNMVGLPKAWEWNNYVKALDLFALPIFKNGRLYNIGFEGMLLNSIIYSLMVPLVTLSTTWLMAYLCYQFPGRMSSFIFRINIVLMMIPIVGSLPSALKVYTSLNLYDTWGYVFVSSITFVGPNFLIFYAVFQGIDKGLKEAAQIDGAGNFSIMLGIIFPLTAVMFGVLFITSFITNWNTYMPMIIWLPSKPSLAYGMYKFGASTVSGSSWPPIQVAGSMIVMLPILIIFLIFRNKIIGNVTIGSFK